MIMLHILQWEAKEDETTGSQLAFFILFSSETRPMEWFCPYIEGLQPKLS